MIPATYFLDPSSGDEISTRGSCSRAQTPMMVCLDFPFNVKQAYLVSLTRLAHSQACQVLDLGACDTGHVSDAADS